MDLKGKTVLITGAAGLIGSATARLAASCGADLILSDIAIEPLDKLLREIARESQTEPVAFKADITSEDDIDMLISRSLDCVRSITSAVHCAYPKSRGWGTHFEELKSESLYDDLTMQLGSAIIFSQRVLKLFSSYGGGDLVHISSIQGIRAPKFEHYQRTLMTSPIEYAAIKSGVIGMTRWLAKYYANKNIRVNCISPGGVANGQEPDFIDRYRKSCTNIGMLTARQVASTVVFLLTADSLAINGQNIIVDDGWSL
jgi:NAD(P)-dependent dehydrogenase (short-subunit alcohol dehydrogenase family)